MVLKLEHIWNSWVLLLMSKELNPKLRWDGYISRPAPRAVTNENDTRGKKIFCAPPPLFPILTTSVGQHRVNISAPAAAIAQTRKAPWVPLVYNFSRVATDSLLKRACNAEDRAAPLRVQEPGLSC